MYALISSVKLKIIRLTEILPKRNLCVFIDLDMKYSIEGYTLFTNTNQLGRGGGGEVAIYNVSSLDPVVFNFENLQNLKDNICSTFKNKHFKVFHKPSI